MPKNATDKERTAYILSGTVISDGSVLADSLVAVAGDRIFYAGPRSGFDRKAVPEAQEITVPRGGAILPGLVDLHCHGAVGGDFPAGQESACRAAIEFLHAGGTTTFLASLVTASRDDLLTAIGTLELLATEGLIAGIHSEGPFLSRSRCGAQNALWLRDPDLQLLGEMLHAANGTLKTMTYAPELPGASPLVEMLVQHGVTPSLGHTDSSAEVAEESLKEAAAKLAAASGSWPGARPTVTHLFNGMPPLHHRHPGPVASSLRLARAGAVAVELIGDGIHLAPETVRMVFELAGAENVLLVTDSMAATGLPDGDYLLGPTAVHVRDSVATVQGTGSLAGGTSTMLDVVRKTIAAGVSAEAAVAAATSVPARLLGLDKEIGSLREGMRADILTVNRDFTLSRVLRHGVILAPYQGRKGKHPNSRDDFDRPIKRC